MKEYIKNAIEYSLKAKKSEFKSAKITSSKDSLEYAHKFYFDDIEIYESSFIILLNHASNVIGYAKISQGGITGTIVDARLVCKYAIESLATSVILVHNHPSGNARPSQCDNDITKKIADSLKIFDVRLLDHVIITADKSVYYSYSEMDKL